MQTNQLTLIGLISSRHDKAYCTDIEKYPKFTDVAKEVCGGDFTLLEKKGDTQYDIAVIGEHDPKKVVLIKTSSKPQGWTWQKFFSIINATRFIPMNNDTETPFYKEIDLQ